MVLLENFRLSQERCLKITGYHNGVALRYQVITRALLEDFRLSQWCCLKILGSHSGVALK